MLLNTAPSNIHSVDDLRVRDSRSTITLHEPGRCSAEMVILSGGDRVCFPSFCSDRQMSPKVVAGGLHGDSGRSDMGHTTMVPGTPGAANRLPNSVTRRRITSEGPIQQGSFPIGNKTATVSRLEGLRKSHTAKGISGRASEFLLSGWNKGTNATYQSGWNSWCDEREIDPISCDVHHCQSSHAA